VLTNCFLRVLDICSAAVIWGAVSSCTAAVKTYQQLLVVRVFLGVTEAVFFPGVIYFLSAWYTKHELGKRLAALFMFQMVGSAFGGFVAAGCLTLDGRYGIAGWRWLFIVLVLPFSSYSRAVLILYLVVKVS
jgi:MFS family permease